MRRLSVRGLCAVLLLSACSGALRAQEIEASVSVNADQLPSSVRDEVASFGQDLQQYLNTTRWTNTDWQGDKVRMNFAIAITAGGGGQYSARMLIGSQRLINKSGLYSPIMKIQDDAWTFSYVRNQPFIHNQSRYDDLSGLIDFYVYVALGLDMDSYNYLDGNSMFSVARDIAQRAQNTTNANGWSTQTQPGAYSRYSLIKELTEPRFEPVRGFIYNYHINGMDLLADNKAAALDSLNNRLTELVLTIDHLVEPSILVRMIGDAKNQEFAQLFTGYPDTQVWRKLTYIDPGHHVAYEEAAKK